VVTDLPGVADECRSMANQGRHVKNGAWLQHVRLGFNYRMDELSAALGCAQLQRIGEILARRDRVAGWYSRLLTAVPGVRVPEARPGCRMSWFVYVVRLSGRTSGYRDQVMARLRAQGVECSDYFRPIHRQPFYRQEFGFRRGDFPVAEAAGDRTVALPFHGRMKHDDIKRVVAALQAAL
jgi:perosamine synthetase